MTHYPYAARVEFVVELARRLHTYGTTAQRLEGAIMAVATRLGLRCEPWLSPTGLILSFSDAARPETTANTTQVIRLAPGDVDLRKMCETDTSPSTRRAEVNQAWRAARARPAARLRETDVDPRFRPGVQFDHGAAAAPGRRVVAAAC